jgi:hypothetical protein
MLFTRTFAMPNAETFSIKPIGDFVRRYLATHGDGLTVDPFARNKDWCTWRNDLDPNTSAEYHMDAAAFLALLHAEGHRVNVALFDPPYSPRQISECYRGFGREVTAKDTQNSALYKRVRDALEPLVSQGGYVLSFGWNSTGMGKGRGYVLEELLLVPHGAAHNDTICIAERKL